MKFRSSPLWVVKTPGGYASSGKASSFGPNPRTKLEASLGSAPVTHPGYSCTLPPGCEKWDRELIDFPTTWPSAVKSGLSVRKKPVVVQMQDLVIWCNGIDAVQVYEPSGGGVYDLGVTAPTAAPTCADQGSGSFAGEYVYAFRYLRSDTGEWSALSPLSDPFTASGSGQYIRVTTTTSAESGVDKVQLFRSKNGSVGLYLIAEYVDTTTTYDDNTADSAIDITTRPPSRPPPGGTATVPVFDWIISYLGRLWGLNGNSLHWSEPNAPWIFPALNQMNLPTVKDNGTGFGISQDTLFISQRRHLYALASVDIMEGIGGAPVAVPDVRLVDDSTGFASQHAVVNVENTLYFMSGEGKIYQIPSDRGAVAQERSPQLESTLKRLFTKRLEDTELGYLEADRKVVALVTLDEASYHTNTLIHDLTNGGWTVGDTPMESIGEFQDSDGRGRMCFGNVRGMVGQLSVGSCFGARQGALSGTISAATINTFTAEIGTIWISSMGMPVHLFDSNWNLVQTNMIAAALGAGVMRVMFPWDVVPDVSNNTWYYSVGGCYPRWKFGWMDSDQWMVLKYVSISYVPSYGKIAVTHETDEESERIVGIVDCANARGMMRIPVMRGSKRFRTGFLFLEGAADNELVSIEWDYDKTEASW